jgi:hypothetical protein
MDDCEIEQGYTSFLRRLNRILRTGDVSAYRLHVARHPAQVGRLSHCLGLNDELAEIEMSEAVFIRSASKDLHAEARDWLVDRGVELPARKVTRRRKKRL